MVRGTGLIIGVLLALFTPVFAQSNTDLFGDTPAQQETQRAEMNANRVGIVTGGPNGTYIRLGSDLADIIETADPKSRLVVMRGRGSARNLQELMYFLYTDLALVQADVLESIRLDQPNDYEYLRSQLAYIARFHPEIIHVFGKADITRPQDLDGKRVAYDLPLSGTRITAPLVFEKQLGVRPKFVDMRPADAMKDLLSATPSIDAFVFVAGRGSSLFKLNENDLKIVRQRSLHFIPFDAAPQSDSSPYEQGIISEKDYSGLIAPGVEIPVWTVPAVLAVYDWKSGKRSKEERYRRVRNFVDVFYSNRGKLNDGPGGFDDNWCSIDLSATVGGWNRFSHVEEWLATHPGEDMRICPARLSCIEMFTEDMIKANLDPSRPEVLSQLSDWKAKKGVSCQ